mgnify:CR=1 FL=1
MFSLATPAPATVQAWLKVQAQLPYSYAAVGATATTPPPHYPVSYTHLRAHETVLDLVCRLLLEKKKHTTHNIHTARH